MTAGRKAGLDLIRVVAIGLVLVHHFRHLPGAPESFRWFGLRADVGVDLFFVLSGWLVGGQLWREWSRSGRVDLMRFWKRRWWRTLPAYLVVLGLLVLLGRVPVRVLPPMLVFLQNYLAPNAWLSSWSLCVEEQFYLVLPLVVAALTRLASKSVRSAMALAVACLVASPLMRWLSYDAMRSGTYDRFIEEYYVLSHLRLEGLALGVAAAWVSVRRPGLWPRGRWHGGLAAAGVVLVALVWVPDLGGATSRSEERMRFFHAVAGYALVSAGTAFTLPLSVAWRAQALLRRPLAGLADLAYGLYLTHELARDGVLQMFAGRTMPFAAWLGLSVASSLAAAWLLRTLVERPLLAMREVRAGPSPDPAGR